MQMVQRGKAEDASRRTAQVRIPRELWRQVRLRAADRDLPVREVLETAIRSALARMGFRAGPRSAGKAA